ncbi:hypothetical protein [uncultured Ruminococcus sp.]|uniref:hypothetical protein n=1 Tax=uncultured Ruminococcus sp. TaxID=165186 RepID=UPI0028038F8C|nr:hypothetical protein [uncultured Ruminococcus sp.]
MSKKLSEGECLFRKVPDNPIMLKADGTISSAVFKDSKGCSVDRKAGRDNSVIYDIFFQRFYNSSKSIIAVSDVTVGVCYEKEIIVIEKPTEENEFHCEIHGSIDKAQLTSSQARHLARNANTYKYG